MSFGKNKSSGKQTSTEALDPQIKAALLGNYSQAQQVANKPFTAYTGERVAGFNDTQLEAQGLLKGIGSGTSTGLDDAANMAKGLGQFMPQQVAGAGYDAAQATGSQIDRGSIQNVQAGLLKNADLSAYQNPYEDQVVQSTLADQERARQIQLVNDRNRAAASSAYGGSRHGVAESLTNEANLRNTGALVSQLRMAGYDKAVSGATGDLNRTFAADQGNQGVDLNVAGQNATLAQQIALANQGATNQAGQFGAANAQEAALANQQAGIAGAGLQKDAAGLLAGISQDQLADQIKRAGLVSSIGDTQQRQQQAVNDADYEEFQRQLAYAIQMQSVKNEALGLLGNPTLTQSQGTNKASGFNIGIPLVPA